MLHIFTKSVNKVWLPDIEFKGYWILNHVDIQINETDYYRFYVTDYFPGIYKGAVNIKVRSGIAEVSA